MIIGRLVYIVMPVAIYLAIMWAPPAAILGETSRIVYFHVPVAWSAVLAFAVSALYAILYLWDKNGRWASFDEKAANSAAIGLLFTILATVTGSLWAKMSWGSYWNWDPRETSIAFLLLIYIAFFSLRSVLEEHPRRGSISSVYLILAMVTVPFFVFIVPRIKKSLHPDTIISTNQSMQMETTMRITLLVSVTAFTLLFIYLLAIRNRITGIEYKLDEHFEEKDHRENLK